MVSNACQGAAREACRSAAIFGEDAPIVNEVAKTFLQQSGLSTTTVKVDVTSMPSSVTGYEIIQAQVDIDYAAVSLIGDPFNLSAQTVNGHSAILAEQD